MAQEIIWLCEIGKGALDLASLAMSVEVPNPLHPATHTGVQLRQFTAAIRMKRVNDLELTDSTAMKLWRSVGLILSRLR